MAGTTRGATRPEPGCPADAAGRHRRADRLRAPTRQISRQVFGRHRQYLGPAVRSKCSGPCPGRDLVRHRFIDNGRVRSNTFGVQEGFANLAVVVDFISRRVVGWSMQSHQTTGVVVQALLMAALSENAEGRGADPFALPGHRSGIPCRARERVRWFTRMDWPAFLRVRYRKHATGRRGNYHPFRSCLA